jgi:hypothetical protein
LNSLKEERSGDEILEHFPIAFIECGAVPSEITPLFLFIEMYPLGFVHLFVNVICC